jgi:hypothetical protein
LPLWLVRPRVKEYTGESPEWEDDPRADPWEPWYDKAVGFVVAALDEPTARRLVIELSGDEVRPRKSGYTDDGEPIGLRKNDAWENPKYSVCRKIAETSSYTEPEVVICDFRSA